MNNSLRIAKPKQSLDGYWIVRGRLNGKPIAFDTSLSPLGPWCATYNGASAKATLKGGGSVGEVSAPLAAELWERARETERTHIRKAMIAAERAGVSDESRAKLRSYLTRNAGRACEWEIVQVTGRKMVKDRDHPKGIIRPVTRRIHCGRSLLRTLAAYGKLVSQNRHTTIRKVG